MRILIIRNYPTTLDIERKSYNIQEVGLAKALVRKGHNADIAFWTKDEDTQKKIDCGNGKFITVYYFHSLNILKNGIFPKRLDELAKKYDVVQISEYNQHQSWRFAKRFKDKMVLLHGPYYADFNVRYNLYCKIFDMFFLRRYKKLGTKFMVKSVLAEKFLIDKGIRPENITPVYVGIDEDALKHDESDTLPEFVTQAEALTGKTLLYIGRLEPRRKSLFMLDLFGAVLEKEPDTTLIIAGNGSDDYVESFKAHMKELGLENKILWTRSLEQKFISHLYKKSDVFLLPTQFEIYGMVLLEAMYFSVTAVTSYNGGSATLIENGESGIYLKSFDVSEWADTTVSLLRDPERRKAIGERAHETIKNRFTWDTICENYISCYEKKIGVSQK